VLFVDIREQTHALYDAASLRLSVTCRVRVNYSSNLLQMLGEGMTPREGKEC